MSSSLSVSRVWPEHFEFVWDQVQPMVRRGLRHGAGDTLTQDGLKKSILNGDMELWAVHDDDSITAIVVLQIVERERGLVLFVVLVAGRDFDNWSSHVNDLIAKYAEQIGAYSVEATARKGMAKWLEKLGWKRKAILMEQSNG